MIFAGAHHVDVIGPAKLQVRFQGSFQRAKVIVAVATMLSPPDRRISVKVQVGSKRTSILVRWTSGSSQDDIHGPPRRHGFGCGAQLLFPVRERFMERRFTAILAADLDGYSRLIGADEESDPQNHSAR